MLALYRHFLGIEEQFPIDQVFEFARQEKRSDPRRQLRLFTVNEETKTVHLLGKPKLAFPKDFFWLARERVRNNDRLHLTTSPLPNAQQGVEALSQVWSLRNYLTVRPRTEQMEQNSKKWLERFGFPRPSEVKICEDPRQKLEIMIAALRENPFSQAVLVDDGLSSLMREAVDLADEDGQNENREALSRIILVGFGLYPDGVFKFIQGSIDPSDNIQVHQTESGVWVGSLPTWSEDNVSCLIKIVDKIN